MTNKPNTMKDFIGIFPNAASEEYCNKIITRFDYLEKIEGTGKKQIWTRQELTDGVTTQKENETYFLGGVKNDDLPLTKEDIILMGNDMPLLKEFNKIIWTCYSKYVKKYGVIPILNRHRMTSAVRLQRYKPSEGYHVWHCDNSGFYYSHRMLVAILYLNTVKEGGETEFLYQRTRISPKQGTLILFPPSWTHTHRGNPPLSGNKYILTTWMEFNA